MRLLAAVLLGLVLASVMLAREPGFGEYRAERESLARMPARFRGEWLQKRGLDAARYTEYRRPETTGLRLVGKYGRGPSNEVTGRGNLVALTLGSEVALLDFANPDSPVVLSEIQFNFIPRQTALHDSFLLTCGNGIEIWDIADTTKPVYRNVIPYGVGDFAIYDTFLYFGSWGTFYSYSIADAANPRLLGTCQDSGYVTAATATVAVARELNDVLGFIDVSNPAVPRRVGTYSMLALGLDARGTICVANGYRNGDPDELWVDVLDISNPANPQRLGEADSVGGYDIHLSGPLAFASGYYYGWGFAILDISDSTRPHVISQVMTPSQRFAAWADWTSNWAYVADMVGLAVMDISNLNSPRYDTTVMSADEAQDVWVDQGRAYVADGMAGLRILDVSNPALPAELGGIDTLFYNTMTWSAVGQDSFAFTGWMPSPYLRAIDVSDPTRPRMAGGCSVFDPPKDMVLRDSLLYVAMAYRFQVVNVARPREPKLVGSCVLQNDVVDLWLDDSLAYVSSYPSPIINVANPASPSIVGNISSGTSGIAVIRDTYAVVTPGFDSIVVYNVSIPSMPYRVASLVLTGGHQYVNDVELMDGDTLAAVSGDHVHLVNVRDPLTPREVCRWSPPNGDAPRLSYSAPYLYVACWDMGVCILETAEMAISEPAGAKHLPLLAILPSVTSRYLRIFLSEGGSEVDLRLYDVTGKEVMRPSTGPKQPSAGPVLSVDLAGIPAGVYVLRGTALGKATTAKVVKTLRR